MLERLSTSLHIGLSSRGIALLERQRGLRHKTRVLADEEWAADDAGLFDKALIRLRAVLSSGQVGDYSTTIATTIVLADDLVRYFMVSAPGNAARLADCQAAAALRFQTLYGGSATAWQLSADWDARHPFVTCAMPHALRDGLLQIASEHRLRIVRLEPHFVAAWNRWHRRIANNAWFGVISGQLLTIGVIDAQRLCTVRSTPLPIDALRDGCWLPDHLKREALLFDAPLPQRLKLCGAVPSAWSDRQAGALGCERIDSERGAPNESTSSAGMALARCGAAG